MTQQVETQANKADYSEHFYLFVLKAVWILGVPLIPIIGFVANLYYKNTFGELVIIAGVPVLYFILMLSFENIVKESAKENPEEILHKRGKKIKKITEKTFSQNKTFVLLILTILAVLIGMPLHASPYVYLIIPFCGVLYKSLGALRSYYYTHIKIL